MVEKEKYIEGTKFGSKHLDRFAHNIWIEIEKILNLQVDERIKNKPLEFDLSKLEWISHDVLVYLTSLFRFLYNNKVNFYVQIFDDKNLEILNSINQKKKEKIRISEKEKYLHEIAKRKTKQTINLWEKWNIYSFLIPKNDGFLHYDEYFNVDQKKIDSLKRIINRSDDLKIYNWHKITPFVYFKLNFGIENETKIHYDLNKAFELQEKAFEILDKYHSKSPFLNKALKSIITKELYENSLDHAYEGIDVASKECYFGISLKNELEINDLENDESQTPKHYYTNEEKTRYWLEKNFKSEAIPKSIDFYSVFDKDKNRKYLNRSYTEFTFIDFGNGIPTTLKD
ncbi:MAG: hypothetical protein ACOCV1_07930 [Bacillota bacterium]